jgi:hypothetical protein
MHEKDEGAEGENGSTEGAKEEEQGKRATVVGAER